MNACTIQSGDSAGQNGHKEYSDTEHNGKKDHLLIVIRGTGEEEIERKHRSSHVQQQEERDVDFGTGHAGVVSLLQVTLYLRITVGHVVLW